MSGDVTQFTDLITSEHQDKPKYMAMVASTAQPFADTLAVLGEATPLYDLDTAQGAQLDVVGQWVGVTRYVKKVITGVYFSLDIAPGLDQGIVWDPIDNPQQELTALPDDEYRILLKVQILNNIWDGTLPTLYSVLDSIFGSTGPTPFVQDNSDLSIFIGFTRAQPTPVIEALLSNGELDFKPAGVQIKNRVYPSSDGPIFAFDVDNTYFGGLDLGAWGVFL